MHFYSAQLSLASVFFLKGNPMPQGPENLLLEGGKLCSIFVQCGSLKGTGIVIAKIVLYKEGGGIL